MINLFPFGRRIILTNDESLNGYLIHMALDPGAARPVRGCRVSRVGVVYSLDDSGSPED